MSSKFIFLSFSLVFFFFCLIFLDLIFPFILANIPSVKGISCTYSRYNKCVENEVTIIYVMCVNGVDTNGGLALDSSIGKAVLGCHFFISKLFLLASQIRFLITLLVFQIPFYLTYIILQKVL